MPLDPLDSDKPKPAKSAGLGETAVDVGLGFGSGVMRSVPRLTGMLPDMMLLADSLIAYGAKKWTGETEEEYRARLKEGGDVTLKDIAQDYSSEKQIKGWGSAIPGMNYQPTTAPGRFSQAVGESAPSAIIPGQLALRGVQTTGNAAVRRGVSDLARQGVVPTAASEVAGDVASRAGLDPALQTAVEVVAGTGASVGTGTRPPPAAAAPMIDPTTGQRYSPGAVEKVGRAVRDEGGTAAAGQELQQLGDQGMIADIGPRTSGQLETLATTPGPQQRPITTGIRERAESSGSRIDPAVDQAFGGPRPENYLDRSEELRQARRAEGNRLYGDVEQQLAGRQIDTAPLLADIERRFPTSVQAGANANLFPHEQRLMQVRSALTNRSDFRSLQSAKEGLDDMIATTMREGGNTRELQEVRDRLVGTLEDATRRPDGTSAYGDARRTYAGDSAILEARTRGETFLNRSLSPHELAREWRDMSDFERLSFMEGARENVGQLMGEARNDARALITKMQSTNAQEKLRTIMHFPGGGGEQGFNDLMRTLRQEARFQGQQQRIANQSATFGRQAASKEIPNPAEQRANSPASSYPTPGQAAMKGAHWLYENTLGNMRTEGMRAAAESHNLDMQRLLMSGPNMSAAQRQQLLAELQQAYQTRGPAVPTGVAPAIAATRPIQDDEQSRPLTFHVKPRRD